MKDRTCCFTGHRIIPAGELPALTDALERVLRKLIADGFRYFGSGGALGFDTIAAEAVLRLKYELPHIRLILVLPCRDQARNWGAEDISRYEAIKAAADKVVYTSESYFPGCMQKRNRHLVDNSSVCVAYCTKQSGGSAYTVNYARQLGLRVINLGNALQSVT